MNICTIIAKNYLAQARVLAESFLRHHSDGNVAVLVIDDYNGYLDPSAVPFETIGIDSIGLDDYEEMAAAYDVKELSTAVKPWLLRTLLSRKGWDTVTYLDPDIWIVDDLTEVERMTQDHGLVLNPHFTAPLPRDGLKPSDEDIMVAGIYNLGFISIGAGPEAERLLDWWSDRLRRECLNDPDNGYFVDQRWVDLVPGMWPELGVLRDPGYNLAYWNLPTRQLEYAEDSYTVDARPLRFFHFSGFDPHRPRELSRHQDRIDVLKSEPLLRICGEYADALLAAGYDEFRTWPYGWEGLSGGLRLDRYSRRLYRQGVSESRLNGSVFSQNGTRRFLSYLTEPVQGASTGSGITRYLSEIRESREDLRRAFPDLAGQDGYRFNDWIQMNADALDIPPALRPQGRAKPSGSEPTTDGAIRVNVAGYLRSELGVGEAARQLCAAMSQTGIEVAQIELPPDPAEMAQRLQRLDEVETPFRTNLICVNADMLPDFAAAAGSSFFEDRYSIGTWFWEVGRLPEPSRDSFGYLDEVWVASDHVADAIRPDASVPLQVVPLPVTPHEPERADRAALGLPDGFCFLFIFDHRSVLKRKNPLGLIESFSRAFDANAGASLVIKSVGYEEHPEEAALVNQAAGTHPNIHVIDQVISPGAKNAMLASCDCYVSLHRAEGFGLTLAEAMYFGKPVIATGYSGNLEFMTPDNSFLVDYTLVEVGDAANPYSADAVWAEPDLDHGAALMRQVFDNASDAAAKGKRASADIRRTHSPDAAGEVIAARLAKVSTTESRARGNGALIPRATRRRRGADPVLRPGRGPEATGRTQLEHLLQFDEPPARPESGRFRRAAKRTYLRLLRPYTAYQRRINESTAEAIDEFSANVLGRLNRMDEEAAELGAQIEVQKARSQEADSATANLAEAVSEAAGRAEAAEQRAESAEQRAESVEQRAESVEQRAESVARLIDDLKSRVDSLASQLQARSEELERRLRSVADSDEIERLRDEHAELAATIAAAIGDLDVRLAAADEADGPS